MKKIFLFFAFFAYMQSSFAQLRVDASSQLHIGGTNPTEKLDVEGAVRIGTTTNTNTGTIRYTGSDFEGYHGSEWKSLTSSPVDLTGIRDSVENNADTISMHVDSIGIHRDSIDNLHTRLLAQEGEAGGLWTESGANIYRNSNVGIGVSSPTDKLQVNGGLTIDGEFVIKWDNNLNNVLLGIGSGGTGMTGTGSNLFLGSYAGNVCTSCNQNVYIGASAGNSTTTAAANIGLGSSSLYLNTTGGFNTAVGYLAGYNCATGINNTYIGDRAGFSTTGNYNVFIGSLAGYSETGSNLLYIENSTTTTPLVWGNFSLNRVVINGNAASNTNNRTFFSNGSAGGTTVWNNDSDRRLKKNISPIKSALVKVMDLQGVQYEWKDGREKGRRIGFIAQDAEKVLPEVVDKSDTYSMQYAPITAVLVEAMKEQQKQIEALQEEVRKLKKK